jgi:signal transduction histidine kinase
MNVVDDSRSAKLLEAALALASELSLPAVLQRIVDLATELTGARYGALGVLGPEGGLIDFITTGVSPNQRAAIGHLPVGRGILGVLIHDARPLRLAEIAGDPRSVGFPPNHPPMSSFLGTPVMARGLVFGNLYLTEKRGVAEFDVDDEQALVLLAAQAGVAIENARLYEEVQRRAERLEVLRELADVILAGSELDSTLALVTRRAKEFAAADLTVVVLPDDEGPELRLEAGDGDHALADKVVGDRASLIEAVIRTGEPIAEPGDGGPGGRGPVVIVPLRVRARPFGTLLAVREQGRPDFALVDVELLETFAQQAAVAFEYIRAQSELRRLAVLEDRERIAGDLHDGAIQALYAVGMRLLGTAGRLPDADQRERVEAAVRDVDRVIRDLRGYIFELRPGVLADRHFDQALRQLVDEFQERTGVTAVAAIDPTVAAGLAPKAAEIVQLTREALSNVSRHAGAATCRVTLCRDGDGALLEIDDDGQGFDPAAVRPGQGLGNLRGRAERAGGTLELTSVPGEGTTVRAHLPL